MKYLKTGFTLAEVLITLGVIGVVAALTIPGLISKHYEKRTITQLKAAQSILSQALRIAEEEYGTADGWEISGYDEESAIKIAEKIKPGLKLALDCGVEDLEGKCAPNLNYKHLRETNENNYATDRRHYKIKLANGSSIYIRGSSGNSVVVFYVDTNGNHSPNTFGRDMFQFMVDTNGSYLFPIGDPQKTTQTTANSCNKSDTGFGCTYYVLHHGNMNYLH